MERIMFLIFKKTAGAALVALLLFTQAGRASAQDNSAQAIGLVGAAMDAYSNLEMEKAKGLLDQALGLKDSVDDVTLAKVYVGFGVLWVGGFTNSSESKNNFVKALCLDENAKVDPLYSAPEIDLAFTEAKAGVSPSTCRDLGLGASSSIPPCGAHDPIPEQKKGFEVPFYVEADPAVRYQLARMAVKFAFDGKGQFRSLEMGSIGETGYGALVDCDKGEIRSMDPDSVQYYIEGYDANNNVICGHGSEETPMEVLMSNEVPIIRRPGLEPTSCTAPVIKKAVGESCMMDTECQEGLKCNNDFTCEGKEGTGKTPKKPGKEKGPKKFYVTLTGGAGVGYMKKQVTIKSFDDEVHTLTTEGDNPVTVPTKGVIVTSTPTPAGMGWSGIPIRLAIGYKFTPKISVELSGRLDGFIISHSEKISCWDDAGQNVSVVSEYDGTKCSTNFSTESESLTDDQISELAKESGALESVPGRTGTYQPKPTKEEFQVAWMINARVRYQYLAKGGLQSSVFGGLGYGHFQYRIPDTATNVVYYPLTGMVAIELGIGLAYYFTDNVGLIFDVPIDFVVGDGFAANFDFNLGLGFGF
jgi:hypothetical protein